MASLAHDVLVQALRDDLNLLPALLSRVRKGASLGLVRAIDSTVRMTRPMEVRPDVVYRTRQGWIVCEVQNRVDPKKRQSWLAAVTGLRIAHAKMGDVVVITASPTVARWARGVAVEKGGIGTTLRLSPVVVYLGLKQAAALLDSASPELGLCAAWAMKHRHGAKAAQVVERAIGLAERLPKPLREAHWRAIFDVLSEKMKSHLREVSMHPDRVPESPSTRKLRLFLEANAEKRGRLEGLAEGLAEGRAEGRAQGEAAGVRAALEIVMAQRALVPTAVEVKRIENCTDLRVLRVWLERAVSASSVRAVLAPVRRSRAKSSSLSGVKGGRPTRRVRKAHG